MTDQTKNELATRFVEHLVRGLGKDLNYPEAAANELLQKIAPDKFYTGTVHYQKRLDIPDE